VLFDEGMNHIGLGSIMPIRLMIRSDDHAAAAAILIDEGLL
jgi:hypothetical protein